MDSLHFPCTLTGHGTRAHVIHGMWEELCTGTRVIRVFSRETHVESRPKQRRGRHCAVTSGFRIAKLCRLSII